MHAFRMFVLSATWSVVLSSCGKSDSQSSPGPDAQLQILAARAALDERTEEIGRQSQELQRQLAELETALHEQESADLRERIETLRIANERLEKEAKEMHNHDFGSDLLSNIDVQTAIPEPDLVSSDTFNAQLEPYGDWLQVPEYGKVWRPQLAIGPAWRPYLDGHWSWSRQGWSWATTEPFGDICYHYGRWIQLPTCGWVWIPGSEWAPAWVSWRSNADCVGWAPLPPSSTDWQGDFDSGCDSALSISAGAYVFIETRHFVRDSYTSCVMPPLRVTQIFHHTTNITNIIQLNARNRFVFVQCGGPERPRIEQVCRQPVPRQVFPEQPLPHRLPESLPRLAPWEARPPTLSDAFTIAEQRNRLTDPQTQPNPLPGAVMPVNLRELPGPQPLPSLPARSGEQPAPMLNEAHNPPPVVSSTPARPAAVTYVGRVNQKDGPVVVAHQPSATGTLTGIQQAQQRQALEAEQMRQRQLMEQRSHAQALSRQRQMEEEARVAALRVEQEHQTQLAEQSEQRRLLAMKAEQDQERERQRQSAELAERQQRELIQRAEQERQHQMAEQVERQRREREVAMRQAAEREHQRQIAEQAERQRRDMAQRVELERQRQMAEQAERQRRDREMAMQQAAERERQRQMVEQVERQRRESVQRAEQERQRQMAEQTERFRRDREAAMQQAAERDRQRQMVEQSERQRREVIQRVEQERSQRETASSRSRGSNK